MQVRVDMAQLASLSAFAQRVVRFVRGLAFVGLFGAGTFGLALVRGGFSLTDAIFTALLATPGVILLLFAQGLGELVALPGRLARMPREGQERVAELTRVAGQARTARARSMPLLVWRLRGAVGSVRDILGIAVPLRVLTPAYLGLAFFSALACLILGGVGLIALVVVAAS